MISYAVSEEGETAPMIQIKALRKADNDDPPQFELIYVDLEKEKEEGYLQEAKYKSEAYLRDLLRSGGVAEDTINQSFERAKARMAGTTSGVFEVNPEAEQPKAILLGPFSFRGTKI